MNHLSDPATRDAVLRDHMAADGAADGSSVKLAAPPAIVSDVRSPKVRTDIPIPDVAYLDRKVRDVPDLPDVWNYINPLMLYCRHLGYRGNFEKALAEREPGALELFTNVEEVKVEAAKFMKVRAVWQFFEAERQGNSIALFEPGAKSPQYIFTFERQRVPGGSRPKRLHLARTRRRKSARSSRPLRRHRRRRNPRAIRRL